MDHANDNASLCLGKPVAQLVTLLWIDPFACDDAFSQHAVQILVHCDVQDAAILGACVTRLDAISNRIKDLVVVRTPPPRRQPDGSTWRGVAAL